MTFQLILVFCFLFIYFRKYGILAFVLFFSDDIFLMFFFTHMHFDFVMPFFYRENRENAACWAVGAGQGMGQLKQGMPAVIFSRPSLN